MAIIRFVVQTSLDVYIILEFIHAYNFLLERRENVDEAKRTRVIVRSYLGIYIFMISFSDVSLMLQNLSFINFSDDMRIVLRIFYQPYTWFLEFCLLSGILYLIYKQGQVQYEPLKHPERSLASSVIEEAIN